MEKIQNKRRKVFTIVPADSKKRIQLKYVKLLMITQAVSILLIVIVSNIIVYFVLETAQMGRFAEIRLGMIYFRINILFIIMAVIAVLSGGVLSLHLSHRFVGPLYRIENILRNTIVNGKPPAIRIRENDELHDLVDLLNRLIEKKIN